MTEFSLDELKIIFNNFTQELYDAQDGKKTSLVFIIHELPYPPIVRDGEIFESLVIGGTMAKSALLIRNGNRIKITSKKEGEKLNIENEEDFLAFVDYSLPKNVSILALNLAYPLKPVFKNGLLDGVLLEVGKENKFLDLIGKQIGKELENYVLTKRNKKIKVTVANDSVCLLTSGLTRFSAGELAAGIVGTGLNFAFFLNQNKLVNLESADFDKFSQTREGKIIDEQSVRPGKAQFEKEVAGAYLYKHFNLLLKENCIDYRNLASTEELDKVSRANIPQASRIAQNLIERSAQLVACQIAGIARFKEHDMVFNMEGSLFWKGNNYKGVVEQTVRQLVPEYKVSFVEIENSAILGAAKLIS